MGIEWFHYLQHCTDCSDLRGSESRSGECEEFEDACSNEFQFVSFFGGFVLLALIGLVVDRDKLGRVIKTGSLYGFGAGILNGAKNFLTLVIYLYLPLSIVSRTARHHMFSLENGTQSCGLLRRSFSYVQGKVHEKTAFGSCHRRCGYHYINNLT